MKNTVSKGIFFYIFILLGIVVGVACVLVSIIMFSPGTEIFGISYYKNNAEITLREFNASEILVDQDLDAYISDGRITTIEIKTNFAHIDVENSDSSRFNFVLTSTVSGLTKNKKATNMTYVYNYDATERKFTIDVNAPDAFLHFNKEAKITLNVPKTKNLSSKTINVITDDGHINIANAPENNLTIANLNATIGNNGYFFINDLAHIAANGSINVESKGGTIETEGTHTVNQFKIKAENTKITLGKINGDVTIDTVDSTIKLDNISGKLYYSAESGILQAKTISGDFECSEDVCISNIFIDKVGGRTLIPNAESSAIEIKQTVGNIKINTTTGNVKIGEINADAEIVTKSGKVTCLINSTSESEIKITTESGNIDARYSGVNGTSTITTTKGSLLLQYKTGEIFTLEYSCTKNKPSVSQGITTGSVENQGTFAIGYNPEESCSNKITVINNEGKSEFKNNLESDYSVFA